MKIFGMALVAVCSLLVQAAAAGDCTAPCGDACSANCGPGCGAKTRKTCKLVCETKKIKVICWGCECEDFCVPGCSEELCVHEDGGECCSKCGSDCGCDCDGKQGPLCVFRWKSWKPGCAELRTRKKLIKYEAEKEIPSFKWEVVETCSNGCGNGCSKGCGSACGSDCAPACSESAPSCTAACSAPASGEATDSEEAAPQVAPVPAEDAAPAPPSKPISFGREAVKPTGSRVSFLQ